jgi:hypothetical protein
MRKFRTAVALAASLALASCSTLDGVTVNGVDVNKEYETKQAQVGNVCAGMAWLCVAGAVAIGVGLYFLLEDDDDDSDN